ncbi:acyl carrier protein phosphodiesterase [Frateuria aurantia]
MNFLAHAVLAGPDPWMQLGGFLGDFVHGAAPASWPPALRRGLALHRAIDGFTDRHPAVVAARRGFAAPYRRFAGIGLDIWFDHCLALDFTRWSGRELAEYSVELQDLLYRHDPWLTPDLRRFRSYMQTHRLPAGYADPEQLQQVLAGVSRRLRFANPLATMLPLLQQRAPELQAVFEHLFGDLQVFVAR